LKKTTTRKERQVPLNLVDEPDGVIRLEIDPDEIEGLANSIQAIGQLQAILVRPVGERFEIVFGHRRYLASKGLGLKSIRAIVQDLDDTETMLMRATENVERKNISAIEEAAVYEDLNKKLGLTLDQIAARMGRSAGVIRRRLDLLRMPPCLQKAVHRREIGHSVAEELWSLGKIEDIEYFLGFAVDHGATFAVVRQWVVDKRAERRREKGDTGKGGRDLSPMETRPVYVACDTCLGAMEIGSETIMRVCKTCFKTIEKALKGSE